MRKEGDLFVEDFFLNDGGLNTADSPLVVQPGQCVGGQNFDYLRKGGFQKRGGHDKLYSVADTQLKSLGLGLWDKPGSARAVIRAAGTKIQSYNANTTALTNLTTDAASPSSDILPGSSDTPVVSSMFNTALSGTLWMAGGGMSTIYGAYSTTKATPNGATAPGGAITTSAGGTGGSFPSVGTYVYAVSVVKASTGAESNVALDKPVTIAATTDTVTITLSGITGVDTTRYTKLRLYRSAVGGEAGFTTGDYVKEIDISAGIPTNTADADVAVTESVNIARAGNVILDNSPLPSGKTFQTLTVFKRRLVTAYDSTIVLSDLNKDESWPLTNYITIPSGGDITGLAVISFTTAYSNGIDEILVIFKQSEVWVVTGDSYEDWILKFIDNSGCSSQPLVVSANGYLAWLGYRGAYLWNGSGKPAYLSQSIEDKFQRRGDIDKSFFPQGCGIYAPARNQIIWYLTSSTGSPQQYALKLDLRLTQGAQDNDIDSRKINGKFLVDTTGFGVYAALRFLAAPSSSEESIYLGDDAGFLYSGYTGLGDAGAAIDMEYVTPYLMGGAAGQATRIVKVVAWVVENGTYNIDLSYWSNWRFSPEDAATRSQAVSPLLGGEALIWDVGKWDEKVWDGQSQKIRALIYNLNSSQNNNEGDCFRLQFSQSGSAEMPIIHGFSIYYSLLGTRK